MEDVLDLERSSVENRPSTTSTELKDELMTSLTSFVQLYGEQAGRLHRASDSFTQATARVHEMQDEASLNKTVRGLFTVFGGALGAVCGGIVGGVGGALGAVGAATCGRLCGKINPVGATVGFVGSVLGGVAGGVFSGSVGGTVCAAAEASGCSFHGVVSKVVWVTTGSATGGAIGGIFGGTVGAAGGAVGGGFGALHSTRFTVYLVGGIAHHFLGTKDSKKEMKKVNVIQEAGAEFSETIKPLVEMLRTIETTCDKITCRADVQSVGGQTAKTLAAVMAMEKTVSDSQRASDLTEFVSRAEEAARQSRRVTEELEKTNAESEKLLVSLRKH